MSYAHRIRWPHGFTCPACGFHQDCSTISEKYVCRFCRRTISITAATLLHGTKKGLCLWLQAAWWACGRRSSLSTKKLQHHLGINSYQTAWACLNRLRQAIRLLNRTKCSGVVLIDFAMLETPAEPQPILAAVESIAAGRDTGRLRLKICQGIDPEVVGQFCEEAVGTGSTVDAPGREPFVSVEPHHCLWTTADRRSFHPDVLQILSTFKNWYRRQRYRFCQLKHDQDALEEFCFFHNAKLFSDRADHFQALVSALLAPLETPEGPCSGQYLKGGNQ
jgi:hypothetical protein